MVFWGEDRVHRRISHDELNRSVGALSRALCREGLGSGDRVAGFLPNLPETVMAALATSTLGGVWSSCSPDFGVAGLLDRFGQIEPRVLFCADGYYYNRKHYDCLERVRELSTRMPSLEPMVNATARSASLGSATNARPLSTRISRVPAINRSTSSGLTGRCVTERISGFGSIQAKVRNVEKSTDVS